MRKVCNTCVLLLFFCQKSSSGSLKSQRKFLVVFCSFENPKKSFIHNNAHKINTSSMAELATQEVKLFGKWSFDDVEVRFYFGNVVGGVVISQTRTTTVPRNGVMPKCFFFFSPFFAELSRARARWKGRRRDARSARGGRESRGDDIFESERCRATCGATRPTTREAQTHPRF